MLRVEVILFESAAATDFADSASIQTARALERRAVLLFESVELDSPRADHPHKRISRQAQRRVETVDYRWITSTPGGADTD